MWIICAGGKRSGSTLQYNILARIVETANVGKRIPHFVPEGFLAIKESEELNSGYKVIKTHLLTPHLRKEIFNKNALVIHSYRDIRDVVVSALKKGWITNKREHIRKFVNDYINQYNGWASLDKIYSRKYEEFYQNIEREIKFFSKLLGIELTEKVIQEIAADLDINYLASIQDKVEDRNIAYQFSEAFDSKTLLHLNHINNGDANQYLTELSEEQIVLIESLSYPFLFENKYHISIPKRSAFISFSQHGDDFLAWQILGKKNKGIVVEIGAFDGVHLSNSLGLELRGWQSICVEPNPSIFPYLEKYRQSSINVNAAIVGDKSIKEIDFFMEEIGVLSGCDFNEEDIKRRYENRGINYNPPKKVKAQALTCTDLLEEKLMGIKSIDILSIDVEGFEMQVLKGLNTLNFDIALFIIEANTSSEKNQILNYFSSKKEYLYLGHNYQNLFIIKKDYLRKKRLKVLDEKNYLKAIQKHPMRSDLTIDSTYPNFKKSSSFKNSIIWKLGRFNK